MNHWIAQVEIRVSSVCVQHPANKESAAKAMHISNIFFIGKHTNKNKIFFTKRIPSLFIIHYAFFIFHFSFNSAWIYWRHFWTSSDLIMPIAISPFVIIIKSSPGLIWRSSLTSLGMTIWDLGHTVALPCIFTVKSQESITL